MCSCCTGLGLIVFTVIKSLISIHPTNLFSIGFHPARESEDLLGLCSVKKQSFSYFPCILAAKLDVAQVRVVEALHVQYGLSCPMPCTCQFCSPVPQLQVASTKVSCWLARPQHDGTCWCVPKQASLGNSKRPYFPFSSSSPGGEQWLNQIRFWFAKTPQTFQAVKYLEEQIPSFLLSR